MAEKNRAYIVVLRWPEGLDEAGRRALAVSALGCDPYGARAIVARAAPCLALRVAPEAAAGLAAAFGRAGGVAAAVPWSVLGRVPTLVRSLDPAMGAPEPMYLGAVPQGDPIVFKASDIRVLVRGRLRAERRSGVSPQGLGQAAQLQMDPLGGLTPPTPTGLARELKTNEMLDVHLADGRCLRCDASRFSFISSLPELGYSDGENVDRLATLLGTQAPGAMVDVGFAQARYLGEFVMDFLTARNSGAGQDRHGEAAFGLYSNLVAAVDRAQRGV